MNATKELQRWWHWVDGEQPDSHEAVDKARDVMCGVACCALEDAAHYIGQRGGGVDWVATVEAALDNHYEALRDLSLSLCEALERMRERVPEAAPSCTCGCRVGLPCAAKWAREAKREEARNFLGGPLDKSVDEEWERMHPPLTFDASKADIVLRDQHGNQLECTVSATTNVTYPLKPLAYGSAEQQQEAQKRADGLAQLQREMKAAHPLRTVYATSGGRIEPGMMVAVAGEPFDASKAVSARIAEASALLGGPFGRDPEAEARQNRMTLLQQQIGALAGERDAWRSRPHIHVYGSGLRCAYCCEPKPDA